jgi:hypothetical protein
MVKDVKKALGKQERDGNGNRKPAGEKPAGFRVNLAAVLSLTY